MLHGSKTIYKSSLDFHVNWDTLYMSKELYCIDVSRYRGDENDPNVSNKRRRGSLAHLGEMLQNLGSSKDKNTGSR